MSKDELVERIKQLEEDISNCYYEVGDNDIFDIDDADICDIERESLEASLKYYKRKLKNLNNVR